MARYANIESLMQCNYDYDNCDAKFTPREGGLFILPGSSEMQAVSCPACGVHYFINTTTWALELPFVPVEGQQQVRLKVIKER